MRSSLILKAFNLFQIVMLISSCQEPIDLEFKDELPRIMIEGNISDVDSIHEVKITRSVYFNDANEFPPIENAKVWITDETMNITDSLISDFPGIYKTSSIKGVSGHTYSLKVEIEGKMYTSISTMPEKVIIDSLSQTSVSLAQKEKIAVVVHFTDPQVSGNCYRFTKYSNGWQSRSFFVRNDIFTNGNAVEQSLLDQNIEIMPGDTLTIDMQCVDNQVYDFFNTLMQMQGNSIYFGTSPSNPVSNISGNCLGYFSSHTSSIKTIIIK